MPQQFYRFFHQIVCEGLTRIAVSGELILTEVCLLPFTGLKTVPLKEAPGGFHPVYMVYRKNVFQSRAVENFINFVKEFKFSETRFMVPIDDEAVEEKQDEDGAEE